MTAFWVERAVEISGGGVFGRHSFGVCGFAKLALGDGEDHRPAQFADCSLLILGLLGLFHPFERGTQQVNKFGELHNNVDARMCPCGTSHRGAGECLVLRASTEMGAIL